MKIVTGWNKPNETPAMKMIYELNKNTTNKLKHLFRTAHYLAVQCRPSSDYVSLSKLYKAKGVAIGAIYLNSFSISHHVYRFHSTNNNNNCLKSNIQ